MQQLADERTIEHKNQQQAGKEKQGSSIVGIIAQLPLGGGPEAIAPTLERMIKNVPLLRGVRQLLDPKPDGSKCW